MENTELQQIKAAIDLMSNTIGTLARAVERLSCRPLEEDVAQRLKEVDAAKNTAITAIEFLDSTGRL